VAAATQHRTFGKLRVFGSLTCVVLCKPLIHILKKLKIYIVIIVRERGEYNNLDEQCGKSKAAAVVYGFHRALVLHKGPQGTLRGDSNSTTFFLYY
jgi:hypothetical protein